MLAASGPERVLWLILILLVVGYLLGGWLNRQRSKQLGKWLQAGVGKLGGKPSWKIVRSLSSGAQVNVVDAAAPMRQVQINYALLTRELPPLWGYEYLSGRRDLLAVRLVLRSEPAGEVEVLPVNGSLRRRLDAAAGDHPWQWQEGADGRGVATRGAVEARQLAAVRKFVERYGSQIQRLSIRPAHLAQRAAGGMYLPTAGPQAGTARPHVQLYLSLGQAERAPAAHLLEALRDLARGV